MTDKRNEHRRVRPSLREQFYGAGDANGPAGYSAQQILAFTNNHPELRLGDEQAHQNLVRMASLDPSDPDIQEALSMVIERKIRLAHDSGDAFYGSYPKRGTTVYPADFIETGRMPTGEAVGFAIDQMRRNIIFGGPNGSGKTTCLRAVLTNPKLLTSTRVVVFGRKRELRGLVAYWQNTGYAVVFQMHELRLAFSQGPLGTTDPVWSNELSKATAHTYERLAAQRLMNSVLNDMLVNRPAGIYPTLEQLIAAITRVPCHPFSRTAQLKESIVACLYDLLQCTGNIWNYGSSSFLEELYSSPGLAVIECDTLAHEHVAFLATYCMRWCYCRMLYNTGGR